MSQLVLKGGNALTLVHNLRERASLDLDFSIEGAFPSAELESIARRIHFRLGQAFRPEGFTVFDVRLEPRPENLTPDVASFWGGYSLEFKVIRTERFVALGKERARREAIAPRPGGKARFEIDISRYEYCAGKQRAEIDGFNIFVYTPAMVVCEKYRAICQQMPSYVRVVKKNAVPRARDFFDIHAIVARLGVEVCDNLEIIRGMFSAKRVDIALLDEIDAHRDFHRRDWQNVLDTIDPRVRIQEFDFYFDYVSAGFRKLSNALRS